MGRKPVDEQALLDQARQFYQKHRRPPRKSELPSWRTILRRWDSFEEYLKGANLELYEEWEYKERIKALKKILMEQGEVPYKVYRELVASGQYPYLPDLYSLNRMFGTCSLGPGGSVWEKVKEIQL